MNVSFWSQGNHASSSKLLFGKLLKSIKKIHTRKRKIWIMTREKKSQKNFSSSIPHEILKKNNFYLKLIQYLKLQISEFIWNLIYFYLSCKILKKLKYFFLLFSLKLFWSHHRAQTLVHPKQSNLRSIKIIKLKINQNNQT